MRYIGWAAAIVGLGAFGWAAYRMISAKSAGVPPLAAVTNPGTPLSTLKLEQQANTGAGHF